MLLTKRPESINVQRARLRRRYNGIYVTYVKRQTLNGDESLSTATATPHVHAYASKQPYHCLSAMSVSSLRSLRVERSLVECRMKGQQMSSLNGICKW